MQSSSYDVPRQMTYLLVSCRFTTKNNSAIVEKTNLLARDQEKKGRCPVEA
jgi:hypothetical protein